MIEKSAFVLDTLRSSQQIPGLQVAVWHAGEIVFSEGIGFAYLEQSIPMELHTKLRIGSVSKTLTSAALGKLYEQNMLEVILCINIV